MDVGSHVDRIRQRGQSKLFVLRGPDTQKFGRLVVGLYVAPVAVRDQSDTGDAVKSKNNTRGPNLSGRTGTIFRWKGMSDACLQAAK